MAEPTDIKHVAARVRALQLKHRDRDRHAAEVRAVRHGDFDAVAPNLFSDEWPRPIVANRIDVMARHASAALSPLPIVTCQSITAASDTARAFADKRTKIANHYLRRSRVQAQMQSGADQFYTYGLLVTSIEPNFEDKFPDILIEDSTGFYPVWDRLGRTVEYARVQNMSAIDLCAQFPQHKEAIEGHYGNGGILGADRMVKVVKHENAQHIVMYVEEHTDLVLVDIPNPLGVCSLVATKKPGLDSEIRGSFDDLIWVQLALHAMQTYTLSAAAQAVQSPIIVPNDVTQVAVGPGEVIRTNDPQGVRRLALDVPQAAFVAGSVLQDELQYGAITPEALGGSIDASVVTGKGVQQLMAGYSQQIAMGQETLVGHFTQVIEKCFRMDETMWPDDSKAIAGHADGTPYKLTYRAGRDIAGDYTVEVQYGGIAGLDPNRALVFLLQARGDGLVSKDYVRRHLPSDMNPTEEESKIAVETLRGSALESLSLYVQQAAALESQGQDPGPVYIKVAKAIEMVQKGEPVEKVLLDMFPPPEPVQQDPMAAAMEQAGMGGAGGGGGMDGFAPGAPPSRGQGGRPDLQMLFAGTNASGKANLQAGVSRMMPAAG